MAQIPHVNNNLKPITLLVAPKVSTVVQPMEVQKLPIGNQNVTILPQQVPITGSTTSISSVLPIYTPQIAMPIIQTGYTSQYSMARFDHVPSIPIITNKLGMTLEEKEAQRLAKQRERNYKHRDKTKPFKDLVNAPTEKDKIIGMFKLCYPQLEALPSSELDQEMTIKMLKLCYPQLEMLSSSVLNQEITNFIHHVTSQNHDKI
jgi:hypothetical protein